MSQSSAHLHQLLREYWGYDAFRPLQEDIIQAVLNGKDVLALLPTGGGKSLCYQVPAMAKPGLCLVISPLIALMKDQVQQLRKRGITAFAVYAGMPFKEVTTIMRTAAESNCRFLYVSPERLQHSRFREFIPSLNINLIAVDEAHCISQWGYDFRPSYRRIVDLREMLPGVNMLAVTASATVEVQEDIINQLQFSGRNIFRQSFSRPKLSYSVFRDEIKVNKIKHILQRVPGSAIVYCSSRRTAQELSALLKMEGVSTDFYHAGLNTEIRSQKQDAWKSNAVRVMVCTNAFGMGIDKPDVRIVIHAGLPDCAENYYQEAGRVGRDGNNAYAVLLFSGRELDRLQMESSLRFPPLEQIREVYQALVNYLQLPVGAGEGMYYDFDLQDFIQKFPFTEKQVLYALRALEQGGIMSFNEQVFLPSTIEFTANRESLQAFENANPSLEPLIKFLLRTYAGIMDQPISVHEKSIAFAIKISEEDLEKAISILAGNGIINYSPRKEKPQLYFIQPRIKAADLYFDQTAYLSRRKSFEKRVAAMTAYLSPDNKCRALFLAKYFGDEEAVPCGICDVCLEKKRAPMGEPEFNKIQEEITRVIKGEEIKATEFADRFNHINQKKLMTVLNFLQSENILHVDDKGIVRPV